MTPGYPGGLTPTVGHVVRDYLPRSATFVHTLLRAQTRFTPHVLAKHVRNRDEFPIDRVDELAAPAPLAARARRRASALLSGYRGTYAHGIATTARRQGCVLLHGHFGWSGTEAVRASQRLEIPLVTTFYGRDVSDPERDGGAGRYRELFARGTIFVCEGPAMAKHLSENGCPPERIRIVRIGLALDQWPFAPPDPAEPLVVMQVSRFVEKKGIDLTLRAFAAARDQLGPSELWLVGDGRLRPELERLAERLGIASDVRFLGMLAYGEYQEAVRRAQVCLQPSRTARDGDTEGGAPTVLLEMYARGIPVVATRHADIPFVAAEPDELVAEEDVDGIARALVASLRRDPADRRVRAERARTLVEEHHGAAALADQVADVYEEALALAR